MPTPAGEGTTLAHVTQVLDAFERAGIRCWLEGGWGVDALVGRQTRRHRDVDVDIDAADEGPALDVLRGLGYRTTFDGRPNRIELAVDGGARVDLHPLSMSADGSARQPGMNGEVYDFPASYFTVGSLGGRAVGCFSTEAQRRFRTGYELRTVDRHDLARLDQLADGDMRGDRHDDAHRARSQRRRLTVLLALNASMIVVLVLVGVLAHSLGVLAAGGDYVADSAAIMLGIVAVAVRERNGAHSKAPTYVAGVNGVGLLVVTALVLAEGVRRLIDGTPEIHGLPVLIVSGVATAVMVAGVLVLGTGAGSEDLHMRSVLLDTVSDALASAAVAVSGAVIYVTGRFFWLDSVLSVVIGVVIGAGAIRLLGSVVLALRHGTDLDIDED